MKSLIYLATLPSFLCVHSLRKTKGYVGSAFGSAPIITPQSLDPISSPDTYTGVTYDPDAQQFDFDAGSAATKYAVQPPNSAVRSPYDSNNYGLQDVQFVMGADYTGPLNEFQPTSYTINPCPGSNTDENACLEGNDDVGIQLSRPISASRAVIIP